MNNLCIRTLAVLGLAVATAHAQTTQIELTVETAGNLGLAPVIASFSDGSYDIFTVGQAASAALEDLAETGSPAGGFMPPEGGPLLGNNPAPPIFTPNGGSNSTIFNVSASNNQFNFASMILPSNDWFIGNSQDIDISSLLSGPVGSSITLSFNTVYDAGTELENLADGPGVGFLEAITGLDLGPMNGDPDVGTDQNGVVSIVTDPDFSTFPGVPAGLDNSLVNFDNIATVTLTVVPEPSSVTLLGFGLLGAMLVRRRRS